MRPGFLAAALLLVAGPARALINPNYTPADLVMDSRSIHALEVKAPKDGRVAARITGTIKGTAPASETLVLDVTSAVSIEPAEVARAFSGRPTAPAVLFISRESDGDARTGAVQIATTWFAVTEAEGDGVWTLDRDEQALELVWAGSADQLARAARQTIADPTVEFPVRSYLEWGGDRALGTLGGPARDCVAADLGGAIGPCVLVLADSGDRLIRSDSDGGPPVDATATAGLRTASRSMAPGDFDRDGRIDLAWYDGKAVRFAVRSADGTFGAADGPGVALAGVRSLAAVAAGADDGPGLVAGTPDGPVLIARGAGGTWSARPIGSAPGSKGTDLGAGGLCVVADFDGDGRCDLLALYAKGLVFYAGAAEAGTFAAPAITPLEPAGEPYAALGGDFDADGSLDVVTGGREGLALLSRDAAGAWRNTAFETGELVRHGGEGEAAVRDVSACDVNADGKQGVALFYARGNPAVFFNRGFACFGLARELMLSASNLKGAVALGRGQSAGVVTDLNGDGAEDLLGVNPQGEIWTLFGQTDEPRSTRLTVVLPPGAAGPVTVTALVRDRPSGMVVVRPGKPAVVNRQMPGPVTLAWKTPDGRAIRRTVILERPTRVSLTAEE